MSPFTLSINERSRAAFTVRTFARNALTGEAMNGPIVLASFSKDDNLPAI